LLAKPSRVQASAKAPLKKVMGFALDMEEPLNDAMEFVQALQMIGDGMVADHNDQGRPISAVARAASRRLDVLKDTWLGLFKEIKGKRRHQIIQRSARG
jgi:hypothetical protein